jgi:hypothetical protein
MKKPYMLPDEDCERLTRPEMQSLKMMLALLSAAAYAEKDLRRCLERVRYGNRLMRMALGSLRSLMNKVLGTVSRNQCKHIYGTMTDYEVRLVPKLTPGSTNIILTKEQGKALMDCAQWQCKDCVKDGEEARKCKLYQLLESTTQMDDYGDGLLCPYALAEWRD